MWWVYSVVGSTLAIGFGYVYQQSLKKPKRSNLDNLKNALLAYAMSKVYKDKFERKPFEWLHDDSVLPHLSGFNLGHACFNYIVDKDTYQKTAYYNKIIDRKIKLIDNFIKSHFETSKQVFDFFDEFVCIELADDDSSDFDDPVDVE